MKKSTAAANFQLSTFNFQLSILPDEGDGARAGVSLTGIDRGGIDCTPDIGGLGHGPSIDVAIPEAFGTVPMINKGSPAVEDVDREGRNASAVDLEGVVVGLCGGENIGSIEAVLLEK